MRVCLSVCACVIVAVALTLESWVDAHLAGCHAGGSMSAGYALAFDDSEDEAKTTGDAGFDGAFAALGDGATGNEVGDLITALRAQQSAVTKLAEALKRA